MLSKASLICSTFERALCSSSTNYSSSCNLTKPISYYCTTVLLTRVKWLNTVPNHALLLQRSKESFSNHVPSVALVDIKAPEIVF